MFDRVFSAYQIGESWESRGRTVTESDLVMFAAFSGDWHPLHTDREWAQKGPFGQRIAHGMLTLSLATGLMVFKPGIVLAFYGIDRVRFVKPTYIQDTLCRFLTKLRCGRLDLPPSGPKQRQAP